LLLQVWEKATISKIMQAVTVAHTRRHHFKYQTSGHVWQGRFKSPVVSDDEYLLNTMRYVEQNPLRAGMVRRNEDYPWSSFKLNTQSMKDQLIDREDNSVFLGLGDGQEKRVAAYREFAETLLEKDKLTEIRRSLAENGSYVSDKFQKQIRSLLSRRHRGRPSLSLSGVRSH